MQSNTTLLFFQKPLFYIGFPALLITSGLCYGVSQYYFRTGYESGFKAFESNQISKHNERINKKYDLKINEAEFIHAVNLIETGNVTDFENQVFKIHEGIIEEVSNSMELSAAESQKLKADLMKNLNESNKDIAKEYIDEYMRTIKPLANSLKEDNVLNFTTTTKVEKATAAISSHICAFSTMIFSPLKLRLNDAQDYAAGFLLDDPCSILIGGFLTPLSAKLIEAGIIKDFAINKNKVEQNYSKMIAELATAEISFTTTKTNTKGSEFFWGAFKSSGTISYQFESVIKAGFDLSDKLEVSLDHQHRVVNVIIPNPKIFDPVISTRIIEFDDQDMIKDLELSDLNAPLESIKQECISYAEASNIKKKAVQNAKFILSNLFSPAIGKGYKVQIIIENENLTN